VGNRGSPQLAGALHDQLQHHVQLQLAGDVARHGAHRLELFAAPLLRGVQPGVLDGDGGLVGEGLEVGDLLGRVLPRLLRVEGEDPEYFVAPPDGQAKVSAQAHGTIEPSQQAAGIVLGVRDVERFPGLRHAAGQPGPQREGKARAHPGGDAAEHAHAQDPRLPVHEEELDVLAVGDPGGLLGDLLQDRLQVQARHDRVGGAEQRLQLGLAPHGGCVQPNVLDGDRRLVGEEAEQLPVPLGEGAARVAVVEIDDPDEPLLAQERLRHRGGDGRLLDDGAAGPRPVPVVVDDEARAPGRDGPAQPFPKSDARGAARDRLVDPGLREQRLLAVVPEQDGAARRPDEGHGPLQDELQQRG